MTSVVLVVDDIRSYRREHLGKLTRYGVEILEAGTLEELDAVFAANRDRIDAIILDGRLTRIPNEEDDPQPDTMDFVRRARSEGFDGLIVAASSIDEFNDQLVEAGCNTGAIKHHAVREVVERLNLVRE